MTTTPKPTNGHLQCMSCFRFKPAAGVTPGHKGRMTCGSCAVKIANQATAANQALRRRRHAVIGGDYKSPDSTFVAHYSAR